MCMCVCVRVCSSAHLKEVVKCPAVKDSHYPNLSSCISMYFGGFLFLKK